jgi:high affinity Mn2+ porin
MPDVSNGVGQDTYYSHAWGMVGELELRYTINGHPGAVRLLAYLNQAHMGSYQEAVDSPIRPANIVATEAYRYKYGFGLNLEQEIIKNVGLFSRLGWNDGHTESWAFTDVDRTASLGVSIKGGLWERAEDTVGLAGVINGLTPVHQEFFAAGGTGILAGDGNLTYGLEKIVEVYYDFHVWKTLHATLDYQYIIDPAYNQDRGPVSVFGARLHWEL